MTRPNDTSIRLKCPRCFVRLTARSAQAGMKRRCPRCQWVFEVPTETRTEATHEEYHVSEGADPWPLADQAYLVAACPVCGTRIHAAEEQVGQEVECPDCGTSVVVPPPESAHTDQQKGPPAEPVEEYLLCDEVDWSTAGPRPAEQTYCPVNCPVCNTLMQVTGEQAGQEIVCPDCRVPMVVPPLAGKKVEAGWKVERVGEEGEYGVREEDDQPAKPQAAGQPCVLAECPVCSTRLHPTMDQVGREIVCPDCYRPFVVRLPPPPKRKFDPRQEAGDPYELGQAIEVPEYEPLIRYNRWLAAPGSAGTIGGSGPRFQHKPPRWMFFSGVFTFPLYGNSWTRWLALSVAGAIVLSLVIMALGLGAHREFFSLLSAICILGLCGTLSMIWITLTSVSLLAISVDTAYGCDEVENWPGVPFIDWAFDAFFVVNSLILSGLPVGSLAWLLDSRDLLVGPFLPASMVGLFPILLLSMLETNSPLNPFSWPVCRSLLGTWRAWGVFYIETAVLVAATGWLVVAAGLANLPLLAPVLVAVLMIYFRLLGRLAWCLARESARSERRSEEAEPSSVDEDDGASGPAGPR